MADLPWHLDPDAPAPAARYCVLTVRTEHGDEIGTVEQTHVVRAGTEFITTPNTGRSTTIRVSWPGLEQARADRAPADTEG